MDITFDHGNNSWKFHEITMIGEKCDTWQTDMTHWKITSDGAAYIEQNKYENSSFLDSTCSAFWQ